jgi:hypothetical protein
MRVGYNALTATQAMPPSWCFAGNHRAAIEVTHFVRKGEYANRQIN